VDPNNVETNIVIFEISRLGFSRQEVAAKLLDNGCPSALSIARNNSELLLTLISHGKTLRIHSKSSKKVMEN
jgi:hypothetical protein